TASSPTSRRAARRGWPVRSGRVGARSASRCRAGRPARPTSRARSPRSPPPARRAEPARVASSDRRASVRRVSSPHPAQASATAYLKLVALGALLGIPAALVAAGFLGLVHYLEHWLWDSLPSALGHSSPPWYLVIGLPVAGACVVVLARVAFPGDGGHSPLL